MLADIVIPNYNGAAHLDGLFASLGRQAVRDFQVILVDDASQDDSVSMAEQLARRYGVTLEMVCNSRNRGFAATCNRGIRHAGSHRPAPWVALLNNDTRPEPAWLAQLVATGEREPDVGMVASKMLFAHRPGMINSAGIAVDWTGIAWDRQGGQQDNPAETEVVEVFGPCGGAGLYARSMLDDIGGFDEDFFAYLEDVDLAWRARLAGWRSLYQPQARLLHAHSGTFGEGSPFKSFLLGRNKVWLIAKNYPQPWLTRHLPAIMAYDGAASLYGLARRRDAALIRGRLAGLRGLGPMLEKRRTIQARWRNTDNWVPFMEPMEAPWRVSRRYEHLG